MYNVHLFRHKCHITWFWLGCSIPGPLNIELLHVVQKQAVAKPIR